MNVKDSARLSRICKLQRYENFHLRSGVTSKGSMILGKIGEKEKVYPPKEKSRLSEYEPISNTIYTTTSPGPPSFSYLGKALLNLREGLFCFDKVPNKLLHYKSYLYTQKIKSRWFPTDFLPTFHYGK